MAIQRSDHDWSGPDQEPRTTVMLVDVRLQLEMTAQALFWRDTVRVTEDARDGRGRMTDPRRWCSMGLDLVSIRDEVQWRLDNGPTMKLKRGRRYPVNERVLHLDWMKGIAIVCMVRCTLPLLCLSK